MYYFLWKKTHWVTNAVICYPVNLIKSNPVSRYSSIWEKNETSSRNKYGFIIFIFGLCRGTGNHETLSHQQFHDLFFFFFMTEFKNNGCGKSFRGFYEVLGGPRQSPTSVQMWAHPWMRHHLLMVVMTTRFSGFWKRARIKNIDRFCVCLY